MIRMREANGGRVSEGRTRESAVGRGESNRLAVAAASWRSPASLAHGYAFACPPPRPPRRFPSPRRRFDTQSVMLNDALFGVAFTKPRSLFTPRHKQARPSVLERKKEGTRAQGERKDTARESRAEPPSRRIRRKSRRRIRPASPREET